MRDQEISSEPSATGSANEQKAISWFGWTSLPLSTRVSEKLVDILIAGEELRVELEAEDAAPFRSLTPELDVILKEAAAVLRKFAS